MIIKKIKQKQKKFKWLPFSLKYLNTLYTFLIVYTSGSCHSSLNGKHEPD